MKGYEIVCRFTSALDESLLYIVKMNKQGDLVCSCGKGATYLGAVCKHIDYAQEYVIHGKELIALRHDSTPPPEAANEDEKVMKWWVERNVQQFMLD